MDKKSKKRIEVIQEKLRKLRQQLAGSKKQMDDPQDIERLEREIQSLEAELTKLKQG